MVPRDVDVVVIGGGAMGLSTAWWLAPRARVVVLERFEAGHHRGASHGDERIFRYLYADPTYVEMAVAADEGWQRLERDAGRPLFHRVGSIEHGTADGELSEMTQVAQQFGVATEVLTASDATDRWPVMRVAPGDTVLMQPSAGWVRAADAVESLAARATAGGADLRFGTRVSAIEVDDGGVRVRASDETYRASAVVLTAGAWTADLVPGVSLPPLTTTEEHVFFFRPDPKIARTAVPSFLHLHDRTIYGLPTPQGLVKLGEHHTGEITTGDDRTFAADPDRTARMERYVATWLPGLVPQMVSTMTCLYTSTPSHDFVLDAVGPVVVGTGFSGHGFKFVPEIGRCLANLALGEPPPHPRLTLEQHRQPRQRIRV
ncbi:MAG TPA: N-methyl-L-tryptophan oxidase [Acidimicrobiales bacterium]